MWVHSREKLIYFPQCLPLFSTFHNIFAPICILSANFFTTNLHFYNIVPLVFAHSTRFLSMISTFHNFTSKFSRCTHSDTALQRIPPKNSSKEFHSAPFTPRINFRQLVMIVTAPCQRHIQGNPFISGHILYHCPTLDQPACQAHKS